MVASAWWKSQPCVAVCGAVSEQRGLICSTIRPKSVNQDSFISFLELLRERTPAEQQLVVLLDNCSMHKSKKVAAYLTAANISVLWNVPYAPQYNGIELVWASAKKIYRDKVLEIKTGQGPPIKLEDLVQCVLN